MPNGSDDANAPGGCYAPAPAGGLPLLDQNCLRLRARRTLSASAARKPSAVAIPAAGDVTSRAGAISSSTAASTVRRSQATRRRIARAARHGPRCSEQSGPIRGEPADHDQGYSFAVDRWSPRKKAVVAVRRNACANAMSIWSAISVYRLNEMPRHVPASAERSDPGAIPGHEHAIQLQRLAHEFQVLLGVADNHALDQTTGGTLMRCFSPSTENGCIYGGRWTARVRCWISWSSNAPVRRSEPNISVIRRTAGWRSPEWRRARNAG